MLLKGIEFTKSHRPEEAIPDSHIKCESPLAGLSNYIGQTCMLHSLHWPERASVLKSALSQSEEISSDFCCFYGGGIRYNEDIMHSFQNCIVRLIPNHPPPLETRIWKLVVRALLKMAFFCFRFFFVVTSWTFHFRPRAHFQHGGRPGVICDFLISLLSKALFRGNYCRLR